MEHLLAELNKAGIADRTVISITPDHYPYGLEQDEGDKYRIWTEMLGHEVDTSFELYESCWLLYCQGTSNPPKVDKYCYSVDILPTILNLFGFEYDSRLLMGSDVMSTEEGLVVFSNRSFITELGRYDSTKREFTPVSDDIFESEEAMKKYVNGMIAVVNNKFKMSAKILEKDYYAYVLK
jgi:phosphoglycerol transferase MdoB-like AlkP superfamily enzyme